MYCCVSYVMLCVFTVTLVSSIFCCVSLGCPLFHLVFSSVLLCILLCVYVGFCCDFVYMLCGMSCFLVLHLYFLSANLISLVSTCVLLFFSILSFMLSVCAVIHFLLFCVVMGLTFLVSSCHLLFCTSCVSLEFFFGSS